MAGIAKKRKSAMRMVVRSLRNGHRGGVLGSMEPFWIEISPKHIQRGFVKAEYFRGKL
jgi:hypothetical protein